MYLPTTDISDDWVIAPVLTRRLRVYIWWAVQGLNLRPLPCEGSAYIFIIIVLYSLCAILCAISLKILVMHPSLTGISIISFRET